MPKLLGDMLLPAPLSTSLQGAVKAFNTPLTLWTNSLCEGQCNEIKLFKQLCIAFKSLKLKIRINEKNVI